MNVFQPHAAMEETFAPAPAAAAEPAKREPQVRKASGKKPLLRAAAAALPSETPVDETALAPSVPAEPPAQDRKVVLEVAAAPRTESPILDMMVATGWRVMEPAATKRSRSVKRSR